MLKWMMVRYKVKADRAAENASYIARVFEQLHQEKPHGLSYTSLKLPDGVSFMHIVALDADVGSNPVVQLPAFKEFTAAIADRCEEPPTSSDLQEIGFYSALGA